MCVNTHVNTCVWWGYVHTCNSHMSAYVMNLKVPRQAVPTGSEMPEHDFGITNWKSSTQGRWSPALDPPRSEPSPPLCSPASTEPTPGLLCKASSLQEPARPGSRQGSPTHSFPTWLTQEHFLFHPLLPPLMLPAWPNY